MVLPMSILVYWNWFTGVIGMPLESEVLLFFIILVFIYIIFTMTLPQDVFSLFGTCFGTLCVPILSLPNFESCEVFVLSLIHI